MSISKAHLKSLVLSPALHVIIIIAVVSLCFGRTIGSYFLADDLGEIKYCWKIFQGDWGLLFANFTGNYMQIPLMNVYRPTLLCSLLFDYCFWQGNANGYYLSNLIYFSVDCLLLYVLIKFLFQDWEPWRAKTTALFSALIFATSPLHCESISWIVGRVDSVCCCFFLTSLLFFLNYAFNKENNITSKQKINLTLGASLLFYVLALTTKEMAIGLPVLITTISLLWSEKRSQASSRSTQEITSTLNITEGSRSNAYQRLLRSWNLSYPFWACTLIYFIIRYLALGTIVGGYSGSIGESQQISILTRWLDFDTIKRLFFPFAHQIFAQWSIYSTIFSIIYVLAATIIILKFSCNIVPWRYIIFFIVWLFTACLPIYKLWGLGYDLEGARFCFFLTLATSTFLPVLLLAPDNKGILKPLTNKLLACSLVLLSLLIIVSLRVTCLTNLTWIHAGREVKAVSVAAQKLAGLAKPREKIILLGIPKENAGAHMILNGKTFQMLLSPPFTLKECWQPFLTFDPIVYGPPQFINASRLKRLLASPSISGPFIWNSSTKSFYSVNSSNQWRYSCPKDQIKESSNPNAVSFNSLLVQTAWMPYSLGHAVYIYKGGQLILKDCQSGDGIRMDNINASPRTIDYLALEIKEQEPKGPLPIEVLWDLDNRPSNIDILSKADSITTSNSSCIFIPLSHYWRWYTQTTVKSLAVLFPQSKLVTISKITLLPAQKVAPQIGISSADESNYGSYLFTKPIHLTINAHEITDVKFIEIQISKNNYFFDNASNLSDNLSVGKTWQQEGNHCSILLSPHDFVGSGHFQIRACALNEHKDLIGAFSDTITLEK